MSFQGQHRKANYKDKAIEEILPVGLQAYNDRRETPEGAQIEIVKSDHPILNGIEGSWPIFLGYNKLNIKNEDAIIAKADNHVFIATCKYEKGRTFASASDCARQ
jgi:uncharacterized membrane protein